MISIKYHYISKSMKNKKKVTGKCLNNGILMARRGFKISDLWVTALSSLSRMKYPALDCGDPYIAFSLLGVPVRLKAHWFESRSSQKFLCSFSKTLNNS